MAPPVFTELLFEASLTPGFSQSPPVPVGLRWVITDMRLSTQDDPEGAEYVGVSVQNTIGYPLWFVGGPGTVLHFVYSWAGRQVIDQNGILQFQTGEHGWLFVATGYVLTLP